MFFSNVRTACFVHIIFQKIHRDGRNAVKLMKRLQP